jgi:hypothetical protein
MSRVLGALITAMLLAGCVSQSEKRLDEAWDICRYHKDPVARDRCVKQQMEKISASERTDAAARAAEEAAEERREAELEAQGIPREAARGVD